MLFIFPPGNADDRIRTIEPTRANLIRPNNNKLIFLSGRCQLGGELNHRFHSTTETRHDEEKKTNFIFFFNLASDSVTKRSYSLRTRNNNNKISEFVLNSQTTKTDSIKLKVNLGRNMDWLQLLGSINVEWMEIIVVWGGGGRDVALVVVVNARQLRK